MSIELNRIYFYKEPHTQWPTLKSCITYINVCHELGSKARPQAQQPEMRPPIKKKGIKKKVNTKQ